MRKNGINTELRPIDGGICAPDGFKVGGVACGIKEDGRTDLAMIVAQKRCRVACVYSQVVKVGAPIPVTKKNLSNGLAQAILINGGIANAFSEDGEQLAQRAVRLVEKYHNIPYDDVVIASTGKLGKPLTLAPFERGIAALREGMGSGEEYDAAVADAVSSVDGDTKTFSFSFNLGDYPCKIGGIYKGKLHVNPNMATTLVFMTTDVNISQKMLSRALSAETRETLNMLALDGEPFPNDMACIMTTCRAENSLIDCVDSEYMKFTRALRAVLTYICDDVARCSDGKTVLCSVLGARSKQVSRAISKQIATSDVIKKSILRNDIDTDGILYILSQSDAITDYSRVEITLWAKDKCLALYEDEKKIRVSEESLRTMLGSPDVNLRVRIGYGNYASTAYGSAILTK